jgi:hypothetical protein
MGYLSSPVGSQVFSRSWPSPMKRIKSVGSGVAVSHTVGFALGSLPSGRCEKIDFKICGKLGVKKIAPGCRINDCWGVSKHLGSKIKSRKPEQIIFFTSSWSCFLGNSSTPQLLETPGDYFVCRGSLSRILRISRLRVKTSSVRNLGANMLGDEQQRCVEGGRGLGVLQADGLTLRRKPIRKDVE